MRALSWLLAVAACSSPAPPPRAPEPPEASESPDVEAITQAAVDTDDEEVAPDGPGWLGIEMRSSPRNEPGVLVKSVIPGSPAAQAGLQGGDVVTQIEGRVVNTPDEIVLMIGSRRAGDRVSVAFVRAGQHRLQAVRLGSAPDSDGIMRMRFVGSPAPAFRELTAVQGSVAPTTTALRGKVVVLEFWASWCAVCRFMVPTLNRWHARYGMQGAQVLGVTTDPIDTATMAASQLGMTYPIASDGSGATTVAYSANALPTIFVVDRRGIVRDVLVGYSAERVAELDALVARLVAEP